MRSKKKKIMRSLERVIQTEAVGLFHNLTLKNTDEMWGFADVCFVKDKQENAWDRKILQLLPRIIVRRGPEDVEIKAVNGSA